MIILGSNKMKAMLCDRCRIWNLKYKIEDELEINKNEKWKVCLCDRCSLQGRKELGAGGGPARTGSPPEISKWWSSWMKMTWWWGFIYNADAWWGGMYVTKIHHFRERWPFLHVSHEKWAAFASVCLFVKFHPHFPLYHQDEVWKLRYNGYHWAEIDHPIKPVNISKEDLDDATKERGGCIIWKKTSWGSIWRTMSWRRSPRRR